jgi:hypothetical protein
MIRHRKDVDWSRYLSGEDLAYIGQRTQRDDWYPMSVFERLGNAILAHSGTITLDAVRWWGQLSVSNVTSLHPELIARGDPMESLMRLKVLRATFFDFPAFDIPVLSNGNARITMSFHMGAAAEEAASFQSLGFCEGVIGLAGGIDVTARFRERAWEGAEKTVIDLQWEEQAAARPARKAQ